MTSFLDVWATPAVFVKHHVYLASHTNRGVFSFSNKGGWGEKAWNLQVVFLMYSLTQGPGHSVFLNQIRGVAI